MNTWALIPVKGFEEGKSRLSHVLESKQRAQLAQDLFEHVLQTISTCPDVDQVAVVTDSNEVAEHAAELGALPMVDTASKEGLADVVDAALAELADWGADRALVCMADLPSLRAEDISRVLRQLAEAEVVLVPDLKQLGTNVLALSPPNCLPSCLGHEDSFRRHQEAARDRGLITSIMLNQRIGFDVDEPSDLAKLEA